MNGTKGIDIQDGVPARYRGRKRYIEDKDEIDCEEYSLFNNNRIILQTLKKRLRILTGKKITDII